MEFDAQILTDLKGDSNLGPKAYLQLLRRFDGNHLHLIEELVHEGYVSRGKYGRKIGDMLGYAYLPLSETLFDSNVLQLIPEAIAQQYLVIALYKVGDVVSVAMNDPTDVEALGAVGKIVGAKVSPVFTYKDEILNAIAMNYATVEGLDVALEEVEKSNLNIDSASSEELSRLSQAQEIKNLLDIIVCLALKGQGSDIHIEPKKHHALLRLRRDGVLENMAILSLGVLPVLVSRIKVLSRLDNTERCKPQDGRFNFKLPLHTIDVRVSILPSLHGETVVIRFLGSEALGQHLEFEALGFSTETIDKVKRSLSAPNGMLIVTGPMGSGKTTTLHCALNHLDNPDIKIVAIEDPIEYERPNITQVVVDEKAGRDFPAVIRSVLQQDPDVIMIGEVRDLETGKLATDAALTGHRVLTSLHTNDAIQAITRFIEMGVERCFFAPSVVGVLGQRLVRKICNYCKVKYVPTRKQLEPFFDLSGMEELPSLYRGKGCGQCNRTGFSGRMAIHEYLNITQALRNCILRGTDYDEVFKTAIESSAYQHFCNDGYRKALDGVTTLEEVVKSIAVTPVD